MIMYDEYDRMNRSCTWPTRVRIETAKSASINDLLPHYTNDRFRHPQTVFLAPGNKTGYRYGTEFVDGLSYDYSDRLYDWYRDKWDAALEHAKQFNRNSAAKIEAMLRYLMDDDSITVIHIVSGVNHSNGYPYYAVGYKREDVKDDGRTTQ